MFTSAFPIGNVDCDSWIVDSGATQHMCSKKSQFSSYSDLSSPVRVEIGDGRALKGVGVGDVHLKITLPNMQRETKGYRLYDFNAKRSCCVDMWYLMNLSLRHLRRSLQKKLSVFLAPSLKKKNMRIQKESWSSVVQLGTELLLIDLEDGYRCDAD
ncbi:hypothetical protein FHG87_009870 [Trinorchestia longiramus]|nr:hypothetical protein FHG87_009870 [Trinorchestia longiramus]